MQRHGTRHLQRTVSSAGRILSRVLSLTKDRPEVVSKDQSGANTGAIHLALFLQPRPLSLVKSALLRYTARVIIAVRYVRCATVEQGLPLFVNSAVRTGRRRFRAHLGWGTAKGAMRKVAGQTPMCGFQWEHSDPCSRAAERQAGSPVFVPSYAGHGELGGTAS
jgi:hypothetical protein